MKNTENTVKRLEALIVLAQAEISNAQAELKRLTQPQEKKVIGREEIKQILSSGELMFEVFYKLTPNSKNVIDAGFMFTTEEKRDAHMRFQQAVANLMYACKPFLTEDIGHAYPPCLNDAGEAAASSMANPVPMFLWVDSYTKALEIAEAHKEDLRVYLNYKWEL